MEMGVPLGEVIERALDGVDVLSVEGLLGAFLADDSGQRERKRTRESRQ